MPELIGLLVLSVLFLGGVAWTRIIAGWRMGRPAIDWQPRGHVPWGLLDVVASAVALLVSVLAAVVLLQQGGWLVLPAEDDVKPTLDALRIATAADAGVKLIVLLLIVGLLALLRGATAHDFGWSWNRLGDDIRTGTIAFAMLAPPVFALQAALTRFFPSKHPLIEMLKEHRDVSLFAVVAFAAAITAPIVEEFVFRVLLQGWLEKLFTFRGPSAELVFGRPADREASTSTPVLASRPHWPLAIVPIAISSLVFALLHWSHGPDWIPLTVLALGLGYLYQRTHRIVPSLTVHALLNGFTVLTLWFELFVKTEQP